MVMTKQHWVIVGLAGLVLIGGLLVWSPVSETQPQPVAEGTATTTVATSTVSGTPSSAMTGPFPIHSADTIASWNFKGAYAGNSVLTAQANASITRLTSLLGKGTYDDYDIYLGIGNDTSNLGDGKRSYDNYNKAIKIYPNKGLAYANLGHLMNQLGARYTAADAYKKATVVEPGMLEYHIERMNFLTRQFPTDTVRIQAALAASHTQFGEIAQVLSIEAEWLAGQRRYAEAIAAWERFIQISPGRDMTAVNAEIARLKAKQ